MKASNTAVGPYDDVLIPRRSEKADWEVELGVVIGKTARYLEDKAKALDYVAGYCVSNDVSERHFQLERGGSWDKGKSAETFNPLGPWLVTTDEITDPQALSMWLDVNGKRMQTGNTKTMVFDVKHLVWYLSQFMVLEAGDVISQDRSETAIELQRVFADLVPVLRTLNPAQLSITLSNLRDALRNRGEALGHNVELVNQYFTEFNKDLPTFNHDISALADVMSTYADATPDLLAMLRNFSVNAETFNVKDDVYAQFLGTLTKSLD
jgi:hypothetical protein